MNDSTTRQGPVVDRDVTLVLFDIDGTLLDVHGAGRQAFINSLKIVFGWDDNLDYIRFRGATDLDVLRRIFAQHGATPTPADEERFFKQLPTELGKTLGRTQLTLYPGVRDLLAILSKYPRVIVGLVTGNIAECARIKLRHFGLHDHFLLGAFGHEHAERNEIAGLALARASKQLRDGQRLHKRFLIGDTPSDISAAAAIGARSIAVATGKFSAHELQAAGADHVMATLADTDRVLEIIGLA